MSYTNQLGSVYLNNTAGAVTPGGDPTVGALTPFSIKADWTPAAVEPDPAFASSGPLSAAARLAYSAYPLTVAEQIPIGVEGSSHNNAQRLLGLLRAALRRPGKRGPIVWRVRPVGALFDAYTEVYGGTVADDPGSGGIDTAHTGGYQLEAEINLVRAAFWGSDTLETAIAAATSAANRPSGTPNNVTAFASLSQGELLDEGQPLNLSIAKPSGMAAAVVYLATVESRSAQSIASTKTGLTSTTGSAFTAGSAIDVSALRAKPGLFLQGFARLTTITAPSKIKLQLTFQSPAGSVLWAGPWVPIGSNTTAQLIDLQGTALDAARLPGSGATQAVPVVNIKSTDGTSVTATLDTLDILLAYTVGSIDGGAGLSSGQSYQVYSAQNYAGGGWLPLPSPVASVVDSSTGANIRRCVARGEMPLALQGASLWLAWADSGGAHTATDTTTIGAQSAPLWHTLRGAT